jgi:hypothetical protein
MLSDFIVLVVVSGAWAGPYWEGRGLALTWVGDLMLLRFMSSRPQGSRSCRFGYGLYDVS